MPQQNSPTDLLRACPGGRNPVVALYFEVMAGTSDDPDSVLALEDRANAAANEGDRQEEMVTAALRRLKEARPVPAPAVVLGF